ncbi:MAG: hypothetical protein A3I02_15820 [Betaproteobacteria bacterium RIFCSPLOWO2_02_FULL_67_26]|nr:MAG: hypothetical protein A3I02_15820 [Betaproteobacteria bacterium RIFCSPLOWO2_02_FULL_67_26]
MNSVFRGLTERRREVWNQRLEEAFAGIREQLDPEAAETILGSDQFLTVVSEATLIACRNHDEEKLRALKYAVVNAALPGGPDELLQLMFLRLIDYLTPVHLATLAVLNDPVKWMQRHDVPVPRWQNGSTSAVIEHCVPALRGRTNEREMVVRDLQNAGLVEQGQFLHIPMSPEGVFQSRATDSGRLFARYTSEG